MASHQTRRDQPGGPRTRPQQAAERALVLPPPDRCTFCVLGAVVYLGTWGDRPELFLPMLGFSPDRPHDAKRRGTHKTPRTPKTFFFFFWSFVLLSRRSTSDDRRQATGDRPTGSGTGDPLGAAMPLCVASAFDLRASDGPGFGWRTEPRTI